MGNIPSNHHHQKQKSHLKQASEKHSRRMAQDNKDVSMLDVTEATKDASSAQRSPNSSLNHSFSQMNIDGPNELATQPRLVRRKSTLIFNDEDDEIPPYSDHQEHGSEDLSHANSSSVNLTQNDEDSDKLANTSENPSASVSTSSLENNNVDQSVGNLRGSPTDPMAQSQSNASPGPQQQRDSSEPRDTMVPVDITWQQGGDKVYVTGSFTGWRKMIGLVPVPGQPGLLHVKLQLPVGTHRFRFIVDDELRFSDYLPTATDQMGNFVNYLEVVAQDDSAQIAEQQQQQQDNQRPSEGSHTTSDESIQRTTKINPVSARSRIALEIEKEPDEIGDGFTRFREEKPSRAELEYTQDIPAVFTDPTVMEQYYLTLDQQQNNHQNMAWLTPPQLPPHLENVPLNSYSSSQADSNENTSGALPIPNHVVLNHLATSSIKHNTLCVASIVRYKRKYVTQILYAPLQ